MITIEEIREKVTSSKSFVYWNECKGLSFDDFSIVNLDDGSTLKNGNLGANAIWIENGKIKGVFYDFETLMMINKIESLKG